MKAPSLAYKDQYISHAEGRALLCYAQGMTYDQTAQLLCISPKTVQRHYENIRLRFDLKGYHSLTHFVAEILPELEKWAELPTKMGDSAH